MSDIIEAERRGCSVELLAPKRELPRALGAYMRDTREGETARAKRAIALWARYVCRSTMEEN